MFTAKIIAPDLRIWPSVDEDFNSCDKVRFGAPVPQPLARGSGAGLTCSDLE